MALIVDITSSAVSIPIFPETLSKLMGSTAETIDQCDILLFVATTSEVEALDSAMEELKIPRNVREGPLGEYRWVGIVWREHEAA